MPDRGSGRLGVVFIAVLSKSDEYWQRTGQSGACFEKYVTSVEKLSLVVRGRGDLVRMGTGRPLRECADDDRESQRHRHYKDGAAQ
jgi:hypothetical protein